MLVADIDSLESLVSLREGDKIINEPAEVAEIFNSYYTKIASDIGFDDTIIICFIKSIVTSFTYKI